MNMTGFVQCAQGREVIPIGSKSKALNPHLSRWQGLAPAASKHSMVNEWVHRAAPNNGDIRSNFS
jgi:hypothetical protein